MMRYLRRDFKKRRGEVESILKKWEMNLLLILIILLVMATLVDLNIPFDQVFKFILY